MKLLKILSVSLIVLFLLFSGSFIWFKYYLEKNVGTDIYYMFEFEADEVIKNSGFPVLGNLFKNIVKPVYPLVYGWDMFVVPVTYEDSLKVYDVTQTPAILNVVGVAPYNPSYLAFKFLQPTELLGTDLHAIVDCSFSQTQIANYTDESKSARVLVDVDESAQIEVDIANFEPYNETITVNDYIRNFIASNEFSNGTTTMQLEAMCTDKDCESVGPECKIKILGKDTN